MLALAGCNNNTEESNMAAPTAAEIQIMAVSSHAAL